MTSIEIYKTYFHLRKLIFLIFLCLSSTFLTAQRGIIKKADAFYNAAHYEEALSLLKQYKKLEKKPELLLRKGICEYHLGNTRESIKSLNQVLRLNQKLPSTYLYLGLGYLDLRQYQSASNYFKSYLQYGQDEMNEYQRSNVLNLLNHCEHGTRLGFANQFAFVENMGLSVNTPYDEVRPVQSPNFQSKYYFTSNRDISAGGRRNQKGLKDDILGHYYRDMYAVELINGNWTSVQPFNSLQNTSKHETLQSFNSDGQAMYYLKSDEFDVSIGEFLVDTFGQSAEKKAFPNKLNAPVFAEIGDKDLYFFKDHILLFSSKRDGGYGGYDLYITEFRDNKWQIPVNLGPTINSSFDEVSPYLTKGGKELYYSSNQPEGFGGFDIFRATYDGQKFVSTNLGLPINSPRDDLQLYLTSDGTQAVFTSNRAGGEGGFDLYLAYWKEQVYDQLSYTESLPEFVSLNTDSLISINQNDTHINNIEIKKRDFASNDLYYNPDLNIFTPQNLVVLKSLIEVCTLFPEVTIELIAHTNSDNLKSFDLFFGLKRAENINDYLVENGISQDRIQFSSMGSSYPVVANNSSKISDQLHNRIDIRLGRVDTSKLNVIYNYPSINQELKHPSFDQYFNDFNEVKYRIRIASTNQMLRSDLLLMETQSVLVPLNNRLIYYIGDFFSFTDAQQYRAYLLENKLTDLATIQPFHCHKPLTITQASKLRDKYPSLLPYLNQSK